jgi:ketosteroid isomerase-like protein
MAIMLLNQTNNNEVMKIRAKAWKPNTSHHQAQSRYLCLLEKKKNGNHKIWVQRSNKGRLERGIYLVD